MTKAELGIKRLCPNCGARYYDLNRDPVICPRCGTEFEVAVSRARPQAASRAPKEEVEAEDPVAAVVVSLEEADEEATESGAVKAPGTGDEEVEADDEDDPFLPDEEEDDEEDVGDIIGDVEEEEP